MVYVEVEGYEGYEVSNTGIVRGLERVIELADGKTRLINSRQLIARKNNYGYMFVTLSKNGESKNHLVHRLVAGAFIPNPDNLPQVNHLNGNKEDNGVENLEWTNASLNAIHAYQTGLNTNCGCSHRLAICVIDTETGDFYCTLKAFCEHFGINYNTGRNALNGQGFPKSFDFLGDRFEKVFC